MVRKGGFEEPYLVILLFFIILYLKIQRDFFTSAWSQEHMVTSITKGQLHCQQMHKNKAL